MTPPQENENSVSSRAKSRDLSHSILQTLKYSDHFGFPLKLSEIHLRLISSEPCSLERVFGTLQLMLKKNLVEKTGDYYHFQDRNSLTATRTYRQEFSTKLLSQAKQISKKIAGIKGVLAVYLTGSLAMSNCDDNADIDLMIITQNYRLWTTRLFLTLYTELLGLRRRPGSQNSSRKICLNLYLSPKSYSLPESKRSLYTAYELIQTIPLFDPYDTHSDLLLSNSWIYSYLPNAPKGSDLVPRTVLKRNSWLGSVKGSSADERTVLNGILGLLESLAYHLQLFYMRGKITREHITPSSAFFHPNDPGTEVLKRLSSIK